VYFNIEIIKQSFKIMKAKFGNIQLSPIQELNKSQQREVKGGGPNSPCCPTSPYFNVASCHAYAVGVKCPDTGPGYGWCSTNRCG
jgi:hypothetical protein